MKDPTNELIGTWISDKRKTLGKWHPYHTLKPKKKKRFASLFGKLKVRYTKKYLHTELDGTKERQPYTVVGSDEYSLVIKAHSDLAGREIILHLSFEEEKGQVYYWLCPGWPCSGGFSECFRKIKS